MLHCPDIVQTPENSLQSILGCLSAHQVSINPMLWTIPGVNHGTGISKSPVNDLQGIFSSQTISAYHLTPKNTLQVNYGGLNGISGMAFPWYSIGPDTDRLHRSYLDLHSDPKQNTEHNFTEKMFSRQNFPTENFFSTENIFNSQKSWPRGRAGGRARTYT